MFWLQDTIHCIPCDGEGRLHKCPKCGHEDSIEGFDCILADDDKLFCNQCHEEVETIMRDCPWCGGHGVTKPERERQKQRHAKWEEENKDRVHQDTLNYDHNQ